MADVLTDRWAFTETELKNPENCTANDLFQAEVYPVNEGDEPQTILVNRRGEALKQHGNGTYSIIIEMRDDIELDVLFKNNDEEDYLADRWRNVITDDNERFVAFQED